jgi:F0F1-type ATP synthase assembly protein I
MFEVALIAGVIVGFLRGGTLDRLTKVPFKFIYLLIVAFVIQIGLSLASHWLNIPHIVGYLLILFSYLLIISGLFLNRKDLFIQIILVGIFLNFLVIAVNGGMPISAKSAKLIGINQKTFSRTLKKDYIRQATSSSKTDLFFLGEIIPLPLPYPFPSVYSVGDILISLGLFLYLQSHLTYKAKRKRKPGEMPLLN